MPIELNDVPQRSPLWYQLRRGCITGSNASKMFTGGTRGEEFGATAMGYASSLVADRIGTNDEGDEDSFDTYEMRRGRELEPEAIRAYEDRMFTTVKPIGFVGHDTLAAACSPDGGVRDSHGRGIIEVKCRNRTLHTGYWLNNTIGRSDMQQVQWNLWITGADFCDFCAYHPDVREDLQLFIARVRPDAQFLLNTSLRVMKYLAMVDDMAASVGVKNWKPLHLRTDELREALDQQRALEQEPAAQPQ